MSIRWTSILFGVLLGCAGAAVVTLQQSATAQSYVPNPVAPRWQQRCQIVGGYPERERRAALMDRINDRLASAGADGWELVSVPTPTQGGQTVWSEMILCFKRPAP